VGSGIVLVLSGAVLVIVIVLVIVLVLSGAVLVIVIDRSILDRGGFGYTLGACRCRPSSVGDASKERATSLIERRWQKSGRSWPNR
jgi:hypothetical protein